MVFLDSGKLLLGENRGFDLLPQRLSKLLVALRRKMELVRVPAGNQFRCVEELAMELLRHQGIPTG